MSEKNKGPSGLMILALCVIVALSCGLCGGPFLSISQKNAETQRAIAEAERLRSETEKIQADVLKDYSEVSAYALRADTRRAHPELIVQDLLPWCCGGLGLILLALSSFLVFVYVKKPEERKESQEGVILPIPPTAIADAPIWSRKVES